MNYVIAICLIYMLAIVAAVIVRLVVSTRKERLQYLKNFKRGKFALIYFAMLPLYYIAFRYNGLKIDGAIWQSIPACIECVVLKFHYTDVSALMSENLFYKITVEAGFALITLNAVMFTISFGGQILLNSISLFFTRKFGKKVIIVVGNNPDSLDIIKSIKKEQGKAVLMDKVTPELRDAAFLNRACYVGLSGDDNLGEKIIKLFKKLDSKQIYVILNCGDDAASLRYVKQLYKVINDKRLTDLPLTTKCGLHAYVFASKTNESAFSHYEEASYGLIKFMNSHEQIAMDFIQNHPFTEFMTEKQLDYATATVKPDVGLNVFMIGFGKINETLFLTSVSNNQFLTIKDGKLQPKAVNYHIYDRNYPAGKISRENTSIHSRSLNHGFMRYSQLLGSPNLNASDYLELIDAPANIQFHPCDFAHPDFYSSLFAGLSDKNAYSYVIISFGTDMENIELAEKLQQKFREWNVTSPVKIFVKVHNKQLVAAIEDDFTDDIIQFFGSDRDTVYNAEKIINEETTAMAKLRHICYIAENFTKENKSISDAELERIAREKWYFKYKQFQRESNIFACLSLRMKLQLIGYDYAKDGDDLSGEFESLYESNDARTPSAWKLNGKQIWDYCNAEQGRNSLRYAYAVQEHQRWCANMICNGVIPSTKEQIKADGGRAPDKRLHGNITTMDGLKEYRELVAEATGASIEDTDVIRYDYQLMDDAVWLLHKCGYKLIKKK